jgi:hypothetical protein
MQAGERDEILFLLGGVVPIRAGRSESQKGVTDLFDEDCAVEGRFLRVVSL